MHIKPSAFASSSEDSTGVSASVISGWYTEVYEPTFAQV